MTPSEWQYIKISKFISKIWKSCPMCSSNQAAVIHKEIKLNDSETDPLTVVPVICKNCANVNLISVEKVNELMEKDKKNAL